jgi:acyl-CoA synthetase (NDP forming)
MLVRELTEPRSIAVIGGSNNLHKPGGKILRNLLQGSFSGELFVVNPGEKTVQGVKSYPDPGSLPRTDLAILAIAARHCEEAVEILAKEKGTKGFIILSAGFGEESSEGAQMERRMAATITSAGGNLIGPNCIGVINQHYQGVFTSPVPILDPRGCDFISGSGATAVFIMEAGIPNGLTFSSVYSVGNSAQTGVEDVLQHLDETFDPVNSSRVKLLYIENIDRPDRLLRHATSLVRKGCRLAAIKAGTSDAGSRAASSHTGALASPDLAVGALLRKAGIVRCHSRAELVSVASVFLHPELKGKRLAVITHAGGPAVMLADALSEGGMEVPPLSGRAADELLGKLYPGSSVANPIDFLATGTAEQLGTIIDYCEHEFEEIDGMIVIFGSPGLFSVHDVYRRLHEKMKTCRKPIFPVLPSVVNVKQEIEEFLSYGRINFPDEVSLGKSLARVYHTPYFDTAGEVTPELDKSSIRTLIDGAGNGYLSPTKVQALLDAAAIPRADEAVVATKVDAVLKAEEIGFPVAMKVVGPLHKSDIGGVTLGIGDPARVGLEFERMMQLEGVQSVMIQPMLSGTQLFAGAKMEKKFGHLILCGMGGIFVEALKDVKAGLAPLTAVEAAYMIKSLQGYRVLEGIRGQEGVDIRAYIDVLVRLSRLVTLAPEIAEMDLNPLLGTKAGVLAVDARIRVEKQQA